MVREIICLKCSGNPEFKKYYESNAITGEWRKEIKGRALRTMSCNKCNDVINENSDCFAVTTGTDNAPYRDWETDRKSTRLNSSHRSLSRMPSSA